MELPERIKFQGILAQGGVFKAQLKNDNYPRFYFVLNKNPQKDDFLFLLTSTTAFDLHRNCVGGDDIHVPLSREDYSDFTVDCVVCCNRPVKIEKSLLAMMLEKQVYQILRPLPQKVLQKILNGIAKSIVVESIVKSKILPNDESESF
jgi:hypothetical protein